MAWLRTHTRQWYILAVLLGVIALAFFHGTAHDVVFSVAVFAFLGACIRHVGLLVRGNDVARGMIGRGADSGGFASWMADESRSASRGRAHDRQAQDKRDLRGTPEEREPNTRGR
jgi:hypothetical protein